MAKSPGKASVPKFSGGGDVGKGLKIKAAKNVAPKAGKKMKSVADVEKFRKKKYGC